MSEPTKRRQPIFISVGLQSAKRLAELRRGEGPLASKIHKAIERHRENFEMADRDKDIIPVVVMYRKTKKSENKPPLFAPPPL